MADLVWDYTYPSHPAHTAVQVVLSTAIGYRIVRDKADAFIGHWSCHPAMLHLPAAATKSDAPVTFIGQCSCQQHFVLEQRRLPYHYHLLVSMTAGNAVEQRMVL